MLHYRTTLVRKDFVLRVQECDVCFKGWYDFFSLDQIIMAICAQLGTWYVVGSDVAFILQVCAIPQWWHSWHPRAIRTEGADPKILIFLKIKRAHPEHSFLMRAFCSDHVVLVTLLRIACGLPALRLWSSKLVTCHPLKIKHGFFFFGLHLDSWEWTLLPRDLWFPIWHSCCRALLSGNMFGIGRPSWKTLVSPYSLFAS